MALTTGLKAPYNFVDLAKAYVDRLRKTASGREQSSDERLELMQEQARLAKAKADDMEMKNAVREGELIEVAEAEAVWANIVREVRSGVLALGSRLAPEIVGLKTERKIKARIDKEAHILLSDLSNEGKG